jgi:uncharacterized RDD family membrane protein YckC
MMATIEQPPRDEILAAALPPDDRRTYVGLATRGIAFMIDAIIIDVVAVVVAAAAALIVSFFHTPHEVQTILKLIGAGLAVLWAAGYFVAFWSATGQTPGDRAMQIRVVTASGERVKPGRGLVRCVGLVLAALPLFAGYALILFDRQRRGLQDRLARTVVIEAPTVSFAEARRVRQREAYLAAPAGAAAAVPEVDELPSADRAESVSVTR